MYRVAVVGSGPSGLFFTKFLLRNMQDAVKIDVFERLSKPFGLLKYGVAPDHPEVKNNFLQHFDPLFESKNTSIYGNADVGGSVKLSSLSSAYHAVVMCTGMSDSNRIWPNSPSCLGADEVVAWYNGAPDRKDLSLNLENIHELVVVGNGNVSLDIVRIFSRPVSQLLNSVIAQKVIDSLSLSQIKNITILGRRGPLNVSFTPAELREFSQLLDYCYFTVEPPLSDHEPEFENRLQQKNFKIFKELIGKSKFSLGKKKINFKFFSSIENIDSKSKSITLDKSGKQMAYDLLIEAIGFHQNQKFSGLLQDQTGKFVSKTHLLKDNLFACGWANTGAKGTIADTLINSRSCVDEVMEYLSSETSISRSMSVEKFDHSHLIKLK